MKSRDIVIGFVVLVILVTGVLWFKNRKSNTSENTSVPKSDITQRVDSAFPSLNVPVNADRADLSDVTGGDRLGVATRQNQNGNYTITVMANLPEGNYQVVLSNGTDNITLGNMYLSKSGYLLNYATPRDLSGYSNIRVRASGNTILEGFF